MSKTLVKMAVYPGESRNIVKCSIPDWKGGKTFKMDARKIPSNVMLDVERNNVAHVMVEANLNAKWPRFLGIF